MRHIDLELHGENANSQVDDSGVVSEDGRFVTEEEYWEKYYEHPDFNYEWNNGILEEKPVSDFKNIEMYHWFFKLLGYYLESKKTGKIVFHDFGFRLALPDKVSIRKPDLAVVLVQNKAELDPDDRSFKGIYDLCVELISDMTHKAIKRDTVEKKEEYEGIGVREYYILDVSNEHMVFYRCNEYGFFEPIKLIDGDILESEVLPGFRFRFSDLFKRPTIDKLVEDRVYCDFVFPAHRELKQIAEAAIKDNETLRKQTELEKQRAEAAQKEAELEKQRAARLAEKLRALGISLD